ncbi:MAG: hypothetical protein RLZZ626_571 [Actinomycetota bacterium]
MKSLVAKFGGTRLEPTLLRLAAGVLPLFQKSLNDPRPFWTREGVSEQQKKALEPLRASLLKCEQLFPVPAHSWLVEPVAVSSKDLESVLRWAMEVADCDLLSAMSKPTLSFDTDWSIVGEISSNVVKQATSGRLQLAFAPKATYGTKRRLIPLEVWKQTTRGNLVTPAWNGIFADLAADDAKLQDLEFAASINNLYEVPFKIDVVYLWVDGSDPKWLAKKSLHQRENESSHGASASRFVSRNELYFSIRSLLQHAAWVNRIWVVTDGQVPELGELAERVSVIDHRDFIPSEYLPTFNSHAITANLHRIPGLSEHFLYLNDDIFFGRNLHPGIWFDTLGRSVIRYTRTVMSGMSSKSKDLIQDIRQDTVLLAHGRGLKTTTRSIQHGPHPLQKKLMEKLWAEFGSEFDRTCRNKFRSRGDIVPEWMHNFAAITSGRGFVGGKLTYNYIVINAKSSLPRILGLYFRRVPSVLCLNDVSELNPSDVAHESVVENRLRVITKLLESDR